MEKTGEKAKSFITHSVFIIIVILGLYFIVTASPTLTGYAVLDASTAKAKLESALSGSAMFSQIAQSSICVVINDPEQPLSLQAAKTSTGWTVSEMKGMCAGFTSEDVIIQFPDYDSFSKMVDDPSPRNLANGAINQDFQILQSRYVELGGNVVCDAAFRVKYCEALKSMATTNQLIDGDLACCLDKLTRAEKKLLEEHLNQGNYEDEMGVLQQPTTIAGMSMTTSIIILAAVILVIVGIVAGVMMGHKGGKAPSTTAAPMPTMPAMPAGMPAGAEAAGAAMPEVQAGYSRPAQPTESPQITDLRNYVAQVISEGYDLEEIRSHLIEIGWDYQTAEQIIGDAQQQLQQQ
ncbi:hypothetical protein JW898_05775 [Candidatus Woesearchaeota archaeon]|nr:hypothetical protein [Candidatus Woesearchaeota archaeon]